MTEGLKCALQWVGLDQLQPTVSVTHIPSLRTVCSNRNLEAIAQDDCKVLADTAQLLGEGR